MPSSLIEALLMIGGIAALAYPALYWSFVRVQTRSLFVCASYGLPIFVGLLFAGLLLPFQVFAIHMAPQLEVSGYLQSIASLISAGEAVLEHSWLALFALYLASPPLVHRRYARTLVRVEQ